MVEGMSICGRCCGGRCCVRQIKDYLFASFGTNSRGDRSGGKGVYIGGLTLRCLALGEEVNGRPKSDEVSFMVLCFNCMLCYCVVRGVRRGKKSVAALQGNSLIFENIYLSLNR